MFLIIVVTRQTSHLRICFSFSYNDPVTLCVIDRMGTRVHQVFFTTRYMLLMWGLLCVVSKYKFILYFKGACVYNPCTVSNLQCAPFQKNFPNTNPIYFLRGMGAYVYIFVIVVTPLTSHFGLCLFFFQQRLRYSLCDMVGACVYKLFIV